MADVVKIGLIGLGKMGRNHLRVLSLLKSVDLKFIYDIDAKSGRELAAANGTTFVDDLDAALPTVDAVVIVTPTSTHDEYIRRAIPHVKTIFVEKPLVDTLERSRAIVDLLDQQSVRVQVGFIERFNPAVLALRQVLQGVEIINIDLMRTNKLSRITDVDVVSDLMIHDIDLALHLNGPAVDVQAYGRIQNGLIAFGRASLRHANGAFSSITASCITEKRIRHIAATTTDRYVDCNLLRKEVLIHKQSREQYYDKVSISSVEETLDVRLEEALLLELMAFVELARGNAPLVPNHRDALAAFEVVDRVQRCILGAQ
jgi:predicted dehydrogenase